MSQKALPGYSNEYPLTLFCGGSIMENKFPYKWDDRCTKILQYVLLGFSLWLCTCTVISLFHSGLTVLDCEFLPSYWYLPQNKERGKPIPRSSFWEKLFNCLSWTHNLIVKHTGFKNRLKVPLPCPRRVWFSPPLQSGLNSPSHI